MSFLWTTKDADSIDVPNLSNDHSDRLFDESDNKSSHGRTKRKVDKHRVSTILRQIDAKTAAGGKRGSCGTSSVTSESQHCDEVSVLSLHSAFLTNSLPIKEDAEFTTPLVIDRRGSNRSQGLSTNPNNSNRSLGLNTSRRSSSHLKASQHPSFSTVTFSDKSLPISQEDIECVEQSWIDTQQEDDQRSHRSSVKVSSPRGNNSSKRRFSTQTYSDKGTVYSSIYKSFCDEECARSVASYSFHAKDSAEKSYFQSNNTVGNARICSFSTRRDGSSTRTTLASSSASNGKSQYEEVSLYPQLSVPNKTTAADLTSKRNKNDEDLLSTMAEKINSSKKSSSSKKKRRNSNKSVVSSSSYTMKRHSAQKQPITSSIKADDNTLVIQNSRNIGKPPLPLSKSSSSSSFTDETTESKVQKELYRLSLELASTLSSLDFKKLEVAKYVKQVSELESIIAKLVLDKEQLETKLERYEMKERNAKRYKEKNRLVSEDNGSSTSKKLSKKKSKKSRKDIEIIGAIHTDEMVQEQPKCVTPTSRDEEEDGNPACTPKSDSNPLEESDVLFPDLNESHLTCQDLYATMEENDDDDDDDDDDGKENNELNSESSPSKSVVEEDRNCFMNSPGEENDDEFPTEILDTTVSLIDPREEIFDDDPFATVYDYGKNTMMKNSNDDEEDENDHRSVMSLQWIPFMKKDTKRRAIETTQGKRLFSEPESRKTVSDMNSSFRSTKTNMTAPVRKSNFFGFPL